MTNHTLHDGLDLKKEILKDLDSGASKTPLTEEERTAILNSLSNPQ